MPKRKREENEKSKEERKLRKRNKKKKKKLKKDKRRKQEVVPDKHEAHSSEDHQEEIVHETKERQHIQQDACHQDEDVSEDRKVINYEHEDATSSEESSVIISPSRSKKSRGMAAANSSDDEAISSERAGTLSKTSAEKDSEIHDTDSSNDNENKESENEMYRTRSPTRRSPRLNASPSNLINKEASPDNASNPEDSECTPKNEDAANDHLYNSPSRRSSRNSTSPTKVKISAVAKSDDADVEYSDQDDDSVIETFKATRKQKTEDEDSYIADESESDESDDINDKERDIFHDDMSFENDESSDEEEEGDDDDDNDGKGSAKGTPLRNINNDDIFDQEDDDVVSPAKRIELTPLKLKKRGQFKYESEDGSDDVEIRSTPIHKTALNMDTTPAPIVPLCSSEFDEITMQVLPILHVCYLAPDKNTRHCFCLQTVYRASVLSGMKQRHEAGGLKFLQPPHFRTAMSDDLVDQIASRFGRKALIIEDSSIYKKELSGIHSGLNQLHDPDLDIDEAEQTFKDRFNSYLNKQMGSNDIYCCPICYCEAQRQFRGGEQADDEDSGVEDGEFEYNMDNITNYSKVDPMSILGSLDHECFEVAAAFCFNKLAPVKKHIRLVHKIGTSEVEINDFLKRFMIRAQDGLLQRFLRAFWKHRIFSGAMKKYWYEGHNQNYILLRVLIERQQYMKEYHPDEVDDSFSESFQQRATKIWQGLSGPYSKSDASDFIDSGNEEIVEEVRPMFECAENIEDDLVTHLRTQREMARGRKHGYDSSSDSSSSNNEDEEIDEEDEIIDVNGLDNENVYIEQSSEDEWVAKKRTMGRKKKFSSRLKSMKAEVDSDDDDESVDFVHSTEGKKVIKLDSSDESDDASSPHKKQITPTKKILILESDEE